MILKGLKLFPDFTFNTAEAWIRSKVPDDDGELEHKQKQEKEEKIRGGEDKQDDHIRSCSQ